MFGIGMPELLVILVVALVVLGPQRLPELARTIGKAMAEFRRQTSEVMDEFHLRGTLDDPPQQGPKPRGPAENPTRRADASPSHPAPPEKPDPGQI